jgi:hypothetical protein
MDIRTRRINLKEKKGDKKIQKRPQEQCENDGEGYRDRIRRLKKGY